MLSCKPQTGRSLSIESSSESLLRRLSIDCVRNTDNEIQIHNNSSLLSPKNKKIPRRRSVSFQPEQEVVYYDHERPPLSSNSSEPLKRMSIDFVNLTHDSPIPSHKKKTTLSFRSQSTLYCYDVPEDELQDWYTDEDEETFKAEAREEVSIFRRIKGGFASIQGQLTSGDLCIVGLEQQLVSPEFSKKRERTKKLVTYAVLAAQAAPDADCADKAERIADASKRFSEWSASKAKMFGDFQYIQSLS